MSSASALDFVLSKIWSFGRVVWSVHFILHQQLQQQKQEQQQHPLHFRCNMKPETDASDFRAYLEQNGSGACVFFYIYCNFFFMVSEQYVLFISYFSLVAPSLKENDKFNFLLQIKIY